MWKIKLLIKQLRCKHDYYHIVKTYGDERLHSYYQSAWRCSACGKIHWSKRLNRP